VKAEGIKPGLVSNILYPLVLEGLSSALAYSSLILPKERRKKGYSKQPVNFETLNDLLPIF
jgi:hypothetical protein